MKYKKNKFIYLISLLFLLLGSCSEQYSIAKVDGELVEIKGVGKNQELEEVIAPYKNKLDAEMNEVIGISAKVMEKGKPEGLLGNWVADLLLETANDYYKGTHPIDFCLINNGGLRTFLPKGDITRKKVFELMPFENELVVITLAPASLEEMFEYIAYKGGAPISGFVLGIKDDGKYKVKTNSGEDIEKRNYRILTSDYLADGGSRMTFFADSLKRENLGLKVREAILEYITDQTKNEKILDAQLDKRIYYAK